MSTRPLRQTLQDLYGHISAIYTEDSTQRDQIMAILKQIEEALKQPDDTLEQYRQPLYQQLVDAGDTLERTDLARAQSVNEVRRIVGEELSPKPASGSELREALQAVRDALAEIQSDAGDTTRQQALAAAQAEIERELDPEQDDDPDTVRERLEETVVQFEADHPRISEAMRRALNILSQSGV